MVIDQKSKNFFLVFFILILLSVAYAYYHFVYKQEYSVMLHVPCNPQTKSCFVSECDPTLEACTGDASHDVSYYKILNKQASAMPRCNPADADCQKLLKCSKDEEQCSVTYCDASMIDIGERCSDTSDKTVEK